MAYSVIVEIPVTLEAAEALEDSERRERAGKRGRPTQKVPQSHDMEMRLTHLCNQANGYRYKVERGRTENSGEQRNNSELVAVIST